jgi:hypothetical protein
MPIQVYLENLDSVNQKKLLQLQVSKPVSNTNRIATTIKMGVNKNSDSMQL